MQREEKIKLLDEITSNIHRKGNIYDRKYAEELARRWLSLS